MLRAKPCRYLPFTPLPYGETVSATSPSLARRLNLGDAVFIGVGSMVGAGVFAAFTPAAQAAGNGLLIGLLVAVVVAFCNATASAQLAAVHPSSGGAYLFGRLQLGPWWGFIAGWSFLVGKTASCAAMAMVFAAYAVPPAWQHPVAVGAVIVLAAVNYRGITRTARLTRIIVVAVLVVLAVVVAAGIAAGPAEVPTAPGGLGDPASWLSGGWHGMLQSAGLLFFAFAGYARIATLSEEVRDPATTIPRAIVLSLGIAVVVYAAIAFTLLLVLGSDRLAGSATPLTDVVTAAGWAFAEPLTRLGAALASLGALLALITGIGRTALAMARERDLPQWFAAVHPRFGTPHRAEVAVAVSVCVLVVSVDLRGAIGFSSFGVLLYYLVANVSAFTQRGSERRYPRVLQGVGALGCVVLAATLPWQSTVAGLVVVVVGCGYRLAVRRSIRIGSPRN